jgi:hypothetical protein
MVRGDGIFALKPGSANQVRSKMGVAFHMAGGAFALGLMVVWDWLIWNVRIKFVRLAMGAPLMLCGCQNFGQVL